MKIFYFIIIYALVLAHLDLRNNTIASDFCEKSDMSLSKHAFGFDFTCIDVNGVPHNYFRSEYDKIYPEQCKGKEVCDSCKLEGK